MIKDQEDEPPCGPSDPLLSDASSSIPSIKSNLSNDSFDVNMSGDREVKSGQPDGTPEYISGLSRSLTNLKFQSSAKSDTTSNLMMVAAYMKGGDVLDDDQQELLTDMKYDFASPSSAPRNVEVLNREVDHDYRDVIEMARRADRRHLTVGVNKESILFRKPLVEVKHGMVYKTLMREDEQTDLNGLSLAWCPVDDNLPHSEIRDVVGDSRPFDIMKMSRSLSDIDDQLRAEYEDYDKGGYSVHFRTVRSHKWHVVMIYNHLESRIPMCLDREVVLKHDDSKFSKFEVQGYVDRWVWGVQTEAWSSAVEHHYATNDHHPEFWAQGCVIQHMDPAAVEHAVIDRMAVGWERVFKSKPVTMKTLIDNVRKFPLGGRDGRVHHASVAYFESLLERISALNASADINMLSCKCLQTETDPCLLHGNHECTAKCIPGE